jgi:ABC-type Fe3+-hydroxamate transport system substrate-binding protein
MPPSGRSMPQRLLIDAIGVSHTPVTLPARIVSLVPSITELLFALGLGDQVVGRTHYCIHPASEVERVPRLGGPKKIKHDVLKALNATHLIVNIDENPKAMVERIAGYVPHIVVTHPIAPEDNLPLYRLLGGIFRREAEVQRLCQRFQQALATVRRKAHNWKKRKVLYLIWRKPWMTVAPDTYIANTLRLVGWETLPASATQRYPVVEVDAALLAETDWVLFSTEPYRFKREDLAEFARQYDWPMDKLRLIDGEMTSWYGSRAIMGLDYLSRFAARGDRPGRSVDSCLGVDPL